MKLTAIFLLAATVTVSASSTAQQISITGKQLTLEKVFKAIKEQAGFDFFYKYQDIAGAKPVDLHLRNATVTQVLDSSVRLRGLDYVIRNNTIVINKPEGGSHPSFWNNAAAPPPVVVKGTVLNEKQEPMNGVSVQLKGTSTGAATNETGTFSLSVPSVDNAVLVFSFIGYTTKELPLNGETTVTVMLEPRPSNLNDIVVTAYSSQRKKDITGAVSIVNVDDMKRQPTGLVANQLQGQAAGVTVISSGQPGAEPQVRIRGVNTFGNNTPLYIVDGMATQNIADLNAADVASMQVLKDAGASSIYGSRASNGVIIITTKKGKGKISVQYDSWFGRQVPQGRNAWDLLSPQEEADLRWLASRNSGITQFNDPLYGNGQTPVLPDYIAPLGKMEGDPAVDPSLYYVNPNYTSAADYARFYRISRANKSGTDWFREAFKPANSTSHNISVSSGNEKGSYYFSLNYFNQEGTLKHTFLKRYTIRSNTQYNITKNIRVGENLAYTISQNPRVNDLSPNSVIFMTLQLAPIIPVYDIMGNYAGTYSTGYNGNNPVAILDRMRNNRDQSNRLFGNIYADIDFLNYFSFHTSFGGDNYSGYAYSFRYPTYENAENSNTNAFSQSSYNGFSWTWTNTLTFHYKAGNRHDIKVMAGTEAYKAQYLNLAASRQDYFSFDPDYTVINSGAGTQTNAGGRTRETLSSLMGRLDYTYNDKYLLSATLRRDGSSKFVNEQYGWFPAFSLGWRLSQERFMKGLSWLNDLKLRGSWGIQGNQLNVNADNGYNTYVMDQSRSYYDINRTNNLNTPGFQVGQIGNPDARWEKNISTNIGLDATLFADRFYISADYYRKDTRDLLYNPAVPGTQGAGNVPFVNIARVKNSGLDLTMGLQGGVDNGFKYDVNVNLTTYSNRITRVTDNVDYFFTGGEAQDGNDFIRNQVGFPVGAFYGYQITGFWNSQDEIDAADETARKATNDPATIYQTDEKVGRFRYADINGDGRITPDDRTILGNPHPDFNYGVNVNLSYRRFDLSFSLYGVQGADIWNKTLFWKDFYGSYTQAKSKTALYDSWTPENHNAKAPIQEVSRNQSANGAPNSYYIENGSYLRMKNILLGYNVPAGVLSAIGIESLRFYIQAANLFTITKYSGLDPEISGTPTAFGVDKAIYPNDRQYLVGLQLRF